MSKKINKKKDKKEVADKPHDTVFKNTFCNKEAMLDFLAANLPSDLLVKIDKENLELTNKSFVDPVGRRGESDLVFKTNINGKEGYLYILCEHQSIEDAYMPLRFMEYNVQLLRQHLKEKGNGPLPVILNICIYNGNKPYKGSNSLLSMFADPELARSCMFDKFHLVDLYSTSEDELLSYKKAAFAAMVLKQGIYRSFNQWFANHIDLIVDLLEKDYISYADQVFLYILQVDNHPDLLETIKQSNPKLKEIAMSVAERLRQEGEQKGRQEGIRIGQEKGKLEGKLEGETEKAISIAKSMLNKGYPIEDIIALTGLSPSRIQELV
ncbi:MAG: Rpn family recombination-promoting nuclease/putative transposase (plasmid) [Candidatus Cardinium sp.]|uniref:Rpn family recombination-promoting nuclease/putative transposase n=1 Tax=Cardinium endosymbiont of Dermatophagoides farinae TaxID=2597823 RepID=UPI00118296C7|nr:Rpn family recombination-promoting nuclease/putative transposase [Cardinium endosymbiont of Dermatophagoides farinae]TSJ80100.1 Rpn family recombination-promoting nuclease/putative transposase [Cardinium endosymbiont of Dermatophagoides farinae]TSJ80124.1 Rpn family recombination-promoting nuclease/putative transposase [Cardinium endosymbiont of Dermatophagoides farinae]UWW97639.1 MAG: Rpn family recombination-promoting nuclease/putative transposase [Candidatus Cardinium sp.]